MEYIQLKVSMKPWNDDMKDVLVAELSGIGYEGFFEDNETLHAYIPGKDYRKEPLDEILSDAMFGNFSLKAESEILPDKNWNEEWEKDYEPVIIDDICTIKTGFHNVAPSQYSIIIEPKMSFGTGHHETTRLMIRQIMKVEASGKKVLDMGCGTGVLGIFALMRDAAHVTAIDIDEWACLNTRENFNRNIPDKQFEIVLGDAGNIPERKYDLILANINRNILLSDMQIYNRHLSEKGILIVSGILETDRRVIRDEAEKSGLRFLSELYENKWISIIFMK